MPSTRFNSWAAYFEEGSKQLTGATNENFCSLGMFSVLALRQKQDVDLRNQFRAKFTDCTDIGQKLRLVLDDPDIGAFIGKLQKDLLEGLTFESKKCPLKAKEALEAATEATTEDEDENDDMLEKALGFIARALSYAPHPQDAEEGDATLLSQCFSDRSLVFQLMERFSEAVEDIDDAMALGVPLGEKLTLLQRKMMCLLALGDEDQSDLVKKQVNQLIDAEAGVDEKERQQEETLEQMTSCFEDNLNQILKGLDLNLPDGEEENPLIPFASASVEMFYDGQVRGRGLKAKKPIEAGDEILREKAFVAQLNSRHRNTHCGHCLTKLVNDRFVPCSRCITTRYCSFLCEKSAWTGYHKLECDFAEVFKFAPGFEEALRMVIVTGVDEALQVDANPILTQQWPEKVFRGDSYQAMASLVYHVESMDPEKLYGICFVTGVLLEVAERMGLVEKRDEGKYLAFGRLLVENYCRTMTNTWAIHTLHEFEQRLPKHLGFGIFPTLSLINHSCDPNTGFKYNGKQLVVTAKRPIAVGEEVTVSYGPIIRKMGLLQRRDHLRKSYNFDCFCSGCQADIEENRLDYEKPPRVPPKSTYGSSAADGGPYQPWFATQSRPAQPPTYGAPEEGQE